MSVEEGLKRPVKQFSCASMKGLFGLKGHTVKPIPNPKLKTLNPEPKQVWVPRAEIFGFRLLG